MDHIQFMKENGIAVFAEVSRTEGAVRIEKLGDLKYQSLFQQLIQYTDGEDLYQCVGEHFPFQMWNQGETWCVLSRFVPDRVTALFYDGEEDAEANYDRAVELDKKVRVLYETAE